MDPFGAGNRRRACCDGRTHVPVEQAFFEAPDAGWQADLTAADTVDGRLRGAARR